MAANDSIRPEHRTGYLTGANGNSLFHQSWIPDHPTAVVLIVHGLGEHSGRYGNIIEPLVDAGRAVYAFDHRGHGRSDGRRAFVRRYDELTNDLDIVRTHVAALHPLLPMVLLGHSMGGNIALGYALDHQHDLDALVLSAPALTPPADLGATELKVFTLLGKIAPMVRPQGIEIEAISRDSDVVDRYRNDPLVFTGKVSAGLGLALITAMQTFPSRYAELQLPMLLVHGTDDRLCDVEGTRSLESGAVNADVTAHYYDGLYHEVFNEPEHDQVVADVLAWFREHIDPLNSKRRVER